MENKKLNKKRITRFAMVGVFNTGFDFGVLNALVFVFGFSDITANIISGTLAAAVSFFLNHSFVFKASGQGKLRKFIIFITITMVGLYGLQNLIIYALSHHFTTPSSWCFDLLNWLSPGTFNQDFVRLNFAKMIATLASLTWNYVLYAKFVFKQDSSST